MSRSTKSSKKRKAYQNIKDHNWLRTSVSNHSPADTSSRERERCTSSCLRKRHHQLRWTRQCRCPQPSTIQSLARRKTSGSWLQGRISTGTRSLLNIAHLLFQASLNLHWGKPSCRILSAKLSSTREVKEPTVPRSTKSSNYK